MNNLFILSFRVVSASPVGQSHPDPATGIWYAKWAFSLLPIALGLVFQGMTLCVQVVFVRDCIRRGRFTRMSGFPFVGSLFICLGFLWSPSHIPVWVFAIPWGLEFLAGIVCVAVRKATHARPAQDGLDADVGGRDG